MLTRTARRVLTLVVLVIVSVSANPGPAGADVSITIDVGEIAKLIWEIWKVKSAEAKASGRIDELVREMNLLVAQREVFIPRFVEFVRVRATGPSGDDLAGVSLRDLALEMRRTVKRIETMLKKIDPKFATVASEIHIKATQVAQERRAKTDETLLVLDGRGGMIDASDLVSRLRKGTCDLRQVIHDIRKASGQTPALSEEDKVCGVKAATSTP
jgi:hypothetical protein